MNIHEFANLLNGREYGSVITKQEEQKAKELGYVVVFGYSDDCIEFRGAIDDEIGCYGRKKIYLDKDGILEYCECECKYYQSAKEKSKVIEAIWDGDEKYRWIFKTEIPHVDFEIFEDGEKFCKGIIFDIKDLE